MSKIMVEISGEMVDNIILQEIQDTKEMLTEQLERVKLNGKGDVFDLDVKTDIKLIKKHIEACDLIYKYYGGK
jgi:hypothetical protein